MKKNRFTANRLTFSMGSVTSTTPQLKLQKVNVASIMSRLKEKETTKVAKMSHYTATNAYHGIRIFHQAQNGWINKKQLPIWF